MNTVYRTMLHMLLLVAPVVAAEVPAADVLLRQEFETFGVGSGLTQQALPGASGGTAMALSAEAMVVGAWRLAAGDYTLLLRMYAPAGDQDGFFVEINGTRTRRTAPIGNLGVVAFPFRAKADEANVLQVIGQEPGLLVDQVALVRGTYNDDGVDFAALPAAAAEGVTMADIPRLVTPARLQELPQTAFAPGAGTVYHQSFDGPVAGMGGEHHEGEGKWGQALYLDGPDGRWDLEARALKLGPVGTIEWWVKPRPAQRLWHDQGWHYFLHGKPAAAGWLQLDLDRTPATGLRLRVSEGQATETLQLGTSSAKLDEWHHLLVSWDLTGERQFLWLLFDGVGVCSHFPRSFTSAAFESLQFCNTPAGQDMPMLPTDGGIDEVHVTSASISGRLAK